MTKGFVVVLVGEIKKMQSNTVKNDAVILLMSSKYSFYDI